ncbi:MAG: helix-turn-helix domain-containing protein [Pyrinomonadaceae bacterium]|nr:helix-turn-helix domain-containing protein [Pyrinomonadaceae bacterium]
MFNKPLAENIGALIRELRVAAGRSQEAFADQCGIHRTYIGSIERGEKAITIETAQKIVESLNISLAQFFQKLEEKSK